MLEQTYLLRMMQELGMNQSKMTLKRENTAETSGGNMGKEKDDGKEEVIIEEESGMEEQDEDESKVDDNKPIQTQSCA